MLLLASHMFLPANVGDVVVFFLLGDRYGKPSRVRSVVRVYAIRFDSIQRHEEEKTTTTTAIKN
jgi:hypothetical protein